MKTKPSLFTSYFFVFILIACSCHSPAQNGHKNFDTAYIQKLANNDSFMITVYGKRSLMAHDPASLLQHKTYLDSCNFITLGKTGSFKPNEVEMLPKGGYPFVKGGVMITGDSLKIDLYFNDYDDHKILPLTWNGDYLMRWKQ